MYISNTLPNNKVEEESMLLIAFFEKAIGEEFAEFCLENKTYISISIIHCRAKIMNEMLKAFYES